MNQRFNELGYQLPSETPELYARNAVTIMTDLVDTHPKTAVNVMEPSSLLLFAGLRGISPYHEFNANVSPRDKRAFDRTLAKYGIHRIGSDDKDSLGFSMVSENGILDVKNRYTAVTDQWFAPNGYDANTLTIWMSTNAQGIDNKLKNEQLPKEWSHDPEYTTQNLQFGMLLGYPGVAISSAVWAASNGDSSGMNLSDVVIADGMPYHGTEVSYDVDPSAVDSTEIIAHKKLWSETIRIVYQALEFEELMKNKQFASAYNRIRQ